MFEAKTVFVLGAGASKEVGLPVGTDLLGEISQLLSYEFDFGLKKGDDRIYHILNAEFDTPQTRPVLHQHFEAAAQIVRSIKQATSIDNVIDALENPIVEAMGKLAISRAILKAEAQSSYFKRSSDSRNALNISNFTNTWYHEFGVMLRDRVKTSGIEYIFENVTIINFNYDRCLENYLPESISEYYGVDIEIARSAYSKLTVYRPYGSLGRLPWQPGAGKAIEFGSQIPLDIDLAAKDLRTFTERVEEGGVLNDMRNSLFLAERIVFLGFAFHRQNMDLLKINNEDVSVVGTSLGISHSDQNVILKEIMKCFAMDGVNFKDVTLSELSCHELFRTQGRILSARSL